MPANIAEKNQKKNFVVENVSRHTNQIINYAYNFRKNYERSYLEYFCIGNHRFNIINNKLKKWKARETS